MKQHAYSTKAHAIDMLRRGVSNADTARYLGVPVWTIGYWWHKDRASRGALPGRGAADCPRCGSTPLREHPYAYVLGAYLGDGHIVKYSRHRVPSLMITCADSWPGLMDLCEAALAQVFHQNAVCRVKRTGCANVKVYSRHLHCLFPQHGPGRKHDRRIVLESWQQEIADAHPWQLIRGLIHSDGCRITNWTTRIVAGKPKRYEYPRYLFTNKSDDIRRIFTDVLDRVGVEWTMLARDGHPFNVSVARRASVALMDAHVGPKY